MDRFAVGDEVFGIAAGSFAEYAAATQDKLARKPAGVSFEQAAVAADLGHHRAQGPHRHVGRSQPGQRVLVLGASGGVGTYAVQLAKVLGAHVTGVASTAKLDLVRALGADGVIDYTAVDFADLTDADERYDVILDIGGRSSASRLRRALASTEPSSSWAARAATASPVDRSSAPGDGALPHRRPAPHGSHEHRALLVPRPCQPLASRRVVPVIGQRFELAGVPEAMRRLASGRSSGKTVVTVRTDAPTA